MSEGEFKKYYNVVAVVPNNVRIVEELTMLRINGEQVLVDKIIRQKPKGDNGIELLFDGTRVFERNTERLPSDIVDQIRIDAQMTDEEINEASNKELLAVLLKRDPEKNAEKILRWVQKIWETELNW